MTDDAPFELFDTESLRRKVVQALLNRPVLPLETLSSFVGTGIYAIYYVGEHRPYDVYTPLTERNQDRRFEAPIYVGKAEPRGVRKGQTTGSSGTPLYSRLSEHRNSIRSAKTTLDIRDFSCRYLVVQDRSIRTSETLLIEATQPLWNVYVDGFGNHDPGKGRRAGQRPQWDTIHPGRVWADGLPPNTLSAEQIRANIRLALTGGPANKLDDSDQISEAESDVL